MESLAVYVCAAKLLSPPPTTLDKTLFDIRQYNFARFQHVDNMLAVKFT